MLVSIVFMALPNGVQMVFAPSPTETATEYYSYFSPFLLGYGNYFPMLIFLLSIIIIFLLVMGLKKDLSKVSSLLLMIAVAASILSWVAFNTFTFIGLTVLLLHTAALVIQAAEMKRNK